MHRIEVTLRITEEQANCLLHAIALRRRAIENRMAVCERANLPEEAHRLAKEDHLLGAVAVWMDRTVTELARAQADDRDPDDPHTDDMPRWMMGRPVELD